MIGNWRPNASPINRVSALSLLRTTTATLANAARYGRSVAISNGSCFSWKTRLSLPNRREKPAAMTSAPLVTRRRR